MRAIALSLLVVLLPALSRAQETPPPSSSGSGEETPPPPPLVDAPKADAPTREQQQGAPTPPPPGYAPQGSGVPYPYSPYGQPQQPEEPGPEIGLMFTETAFGMLTAAGSSLLLWYLVIKPLGGGLGAAGGDAAAIQNIIFILGFSSVPMAVAQTELSLANGSRYYYSESWPASLSGLAAQAGVIGLYYLARPHTRDAGEAVLLIGTIVGVPVVEMIVINLTKQPRWKGGPRFGSLLSVSEEGGLRANVPAPMPMPVQTASGPQLGLGFSLLQGRF